MRKTVCKLVLLLSVMLLFGCSKPAVHPDGIMPDDVFGLDYWIYCDVTGESFGGFRKLESWGITDYINGKYYTPDEAGLLKLPDGEYVSYGVSEWPDFSDGRKYVTSIFINDSDVMIFGLTGDSTTEEISAVLESKGFTKSEYVNNGRGYVSPDKGWKIYFDETDSTIRIYAITPSGGHLIF
ncbi:MAG: hypothetical protein IJU75_01005 [Clostridia bacterium]|nr:hypothetical protein [Clostridia bacterium]